MNRSNLPTFILLLSLLSLSSCVSNKKYQELNLLKNHYKEQAETLRKVEAERDALALQLEEQRQKQQQTKDQLTEISLDMIEKKTRLEEREKSLERLETEHQRLQAGYAEDRQKWSAQLDNAQRAYERKEMEAERLFYMLGEDRNLLDSTLFTYEDSERRLMRFHRERDRIMAEMATLGERLQKEIGRTAADQFTLSSDSVSLTLRLEYDFLYEESGDALSAPGARAIRHIARILKDFQAYQLTVAAHTSASGSTDNQWNACLTRAALVTTALAKNGLPPEKLTAASRGSFHPIAGEDSPEGQLANKRTELIISPKVDELLQILF